MHPPAADGHGHAVKSSPGGISLPQTVMLTPCDSGSSGTFQIYFLSLRGDKGACCCPKHPGLTSDAIVSFSTA